MHKIFLVIFTLFILSSAYPQELYLSLKSGKPFFAKVLKYKDKKLSYRYKKTNYEKSIKQFSEESQRRIKDFYRKPKKAIIYTLNKKNFKAKIKAFDRENITIQSAKKTIKIKRSEIRKIVFENGHIFQVQPKKIDGSFTADVELVFYSSIEQEMYVIGDFNDWEERKTKMNKKGNRFSCTISVSNATRYKFVSYRNYTCHYNIDPLNAEEDEGCPSITLRSNKPTTNENPLVQYIYSKNFDYFTFNRPKQIFEMERVHKALTTKILAFYSNDLKASRGKLRSYATFKQGAFAINGSSEICDSGDCVNTHEMIHGLLATPRFGPFAEGFAQCFQLSGNAEFMPVKKEYNFDTNPTISVQRKIKDKPDIDIKHVMANFSGYLYHEMASFIYWSCYVDKGNLKKFVDWSRDLNHDHTHAFQSYKAIYGYDISKANKKWNKWVRKVSPRQCDVDWHYGKYLKQNKALPAAKDSALYSHGRILTNKYRKSKKIFLHPGNAFRSQSGWSHPRHNRSIDGNTLRSANKKYEQGIGVHANSKIEYLVDSSFSEFYAECAIDDETVAGKDIGASVIFRVLFDDKEVFKSPVVRYKDTPNKIRLKLNGCKKITLEVTDAGDGGHSDHANWLNIFLK